MEIATATGLSEDKMREVDMHSFINLITVVYTQLHLLGMEDERVKEKLSPVIADTEELTAAIRRQNEAYLNKEWVTLYIERLLNAVEETGELAGEAHHLQNMRSIMKVFQIRFDELRQNWAAPEKWHRFNIAAFQEDFRKFFYAMEKNSRGRYRIIKNIAEQEEKDYLVNFEISSDYNDGSCIYMPLMLKDVLRDLIANARKYTPPGGRIQIGILQKAGQLRMVVEDNGHGIPEEEIPRVIEYGYRASNVRDKIRTMGGGFGLTKSWQITRRLNGRMWIESELGRGTKVTLHIPIPE